MRNDLLVRRTVLGLFACAVVVSVATGCGDKKASSKKNDISISSEVDSSKEDHKSPVLDIATEKESESQSQLDTEKESESVSESEEVTEVASETLSEPEPEPEPVPYVVSTETRKEQISAFCRLGITKTTYKYTVVDVYSDGSKVDTDNVWTDVEKSGSYNNDQNELYNYAVSLVDANWNQLVTAANETNAIRREVGLHDLTLSRDLCIAATMRSIEMDYGNYFAHARYFKDENGQEVKCFQIFDQLGMQYGMVCENIAAGYESAESVVDGWKHSKGHYTNMVREKLNYIGIGLCGDCMGSYVNYWTQLFDSVEPVITTY